jgi:pilus assembly protein CpaE
VLTFQTSTTDFAVAVVDDDPKLRTRLAMQLGESARASAFNSIEALQERFEEGDPLVVVFGPSYGEQSRLTQIEALTRYRPEVGAVLVASTLSTEVLQQALRAGVRDVLTSPAESSQLAESVVRVATSLTAVQPQRVFPNTPAEPEVPSDLGRVTTVFSTKGGAGKTVVATNLAVLVARRSERPVVLIDGDLQFGDVAVMLKLTPQHTIVDAVAAIHRLDAQLLQSLLIRHDPSGLLVLAAPVEPAFADQVSRDAMVQIVQTLRQFCGHVIIDTPAYFNEVVLGLLEESDDIVLVAGMDVPNIKNMKLGLQTLRLLNIPSSKLKLVLNRSNSKVKLDIGEVEKALQMKADCLVPSDIVVPQAVNKGVPAVLDAPKSGVARALEQLAESFSTTVAKRSRR